MHNSIMEDNPRKNLLFPYSSIRKSQENLVNDVADIVEKKGQLIAHAPTGLGKTAATLAPILSHILKEEDTTVFFLTSRHTQHQIVLKTLKEIKDKHKINFNAVSIIGKKWMCAMPETASLFAKEFISFCKALRNDDQCEFYTNIGSRSKPSINCEKAIKQISNISPVDTDRIVSICKKEKLCPYEVALMLASKAKVIVTDYFYLLDPFIKEIFLKKIGKTLDKSIIIFDEAHNLPSRTRDLMTTKISTFIIERAIKEANKYRFDEAETYLNQMLDTMRGLAEEITEGSEMILDKDAFTEAINKIKDYDEIAAALEFAADEVRETERASYIGSVALFMELWPGPDKGYVRILSKIQTKYGEMASIAYRCLDPSLFTKSLVSEAYSTILMSGTLTPTSMYKDLLGFPDKAIEKNYESPFPEKNRLVMVVPKTTTKYNMRNEEQYMEIAKTCNEIINKIPGNCAIFFPSYNLRDKVNVYITENCSKNIFLEIQGMEKEAKKDLLEEFKEKKDAVLLGIASGSFGEGVDIPGNILKGVIVVGLPLQRPNLETKELIKYYDEKFGKGWEYGYTMPGITKALQNAGRCIRSEKDKGVMVFLDQRYSWPNYIKCFPEDWDIKITVDYNEEIDNFFKKS